MSLRTFRVTVLGTTLVGRAEASLRAQVGSFVQGLRTRPPAGGLRDGSSVDLGFARVLLVADGAGVLRLVTPDLHGDPARDVTDDLSTTLRVHHVQDAFTRYVGLVPAPTRHDQVVAVEDGALEADDVYLLRAVDWSPGMEAVSGWFVGRPGSGDAPWEPVPAHRLLQLRPSLVPVLALPDGSQVDFVGDEAVCVQDGQQRVLWEAEPELQPG